MKTPALNLAKDIGWRGCRSQIWALGTMAKLLRANGDVRKIRSMNKKWGLTGLEIRSLLGAAVHLFPLDRNRMMLMQGNVPEHTLLINQRAMELLERSRHSRRAPASDIVVIRGDVLVATYEELSLEELFALAELAF